ncbi:MAG: glutathione S-transferase family protein, partial [Alphaproteobacteria bacterium]|nr:glutathione S-transferase family protein [Alphaproteobacteria bacterium]
KPDWFLAISPLGKVPVLKINDVVLFESSVINEYLDEVYPPSLHPADPLQKAQHRALVEFSSAILGTQFQLKMAQTQEDAQKCKTQLHSQLKHLQSYIGGKFIAGAQYHLVDLACAPLLERSLLIQKHFIADLFDGLDALVAWTDNVMALDAVQKSIPDDMEEVSLQGGFNWQA